jgi:hypothetical protein
VFHLATLLQERYLEQLMAGPVLSAEEKDVIRWGNNAKITIPKRFSQSGKHAQTYRAATAIECLVSQFLGVRCAWAAMHVLTVVSTATRYVVSRPSACAHQLPVLAPIQRCCR